MNYLDESFLNRLPGEFTRKQLLSLVLKAGYSISKASNIMEVGLITGEIERISRGVYRKQDSKKIEAIRLHELGLSYRQIAEKLGVSKSQIGNYLDSGQQTGH